MSLLSILGQYPGFLCSPPPDTQERFNNLQPEGDVHSAGEMPSFLMDSKKEQPGAGARAKPVTHSPSTHPQFRNAAGFLKSTLPHHADQFYNPIRQAGKLTPRSARPAEEKSKD